MEELPFAQRAEYIETHCKMKFASQPVPAVILMRISDGTDGLLLLLRPNRLGTPPSHINAAPAVHHQ
ncbi:hypothetical protein [Psychromicrobium lacuslunae]|uniref:hypothetical protein n=1 Tax=Psychromicrobium lacuslunae TaxID=1618207 RepID=UPI0012FED6E9|nr:hypothetical protein [Psychromicrobium lacuslunae]